MKLICNITDKSLNECKIFETKAIYQKDKIIYIQEQEKYKLNIVSPKKLILKRITPVIESTIYFEENKTKPSIYYIKDQDISLEIDIKTQKIEMTDKRIKILYTVIDSNTDYEYNIEMSDE